VDYEEVIRELGTTIPVYILKATISRRREERTGEDAFVLKTLPPGDMLTYDYQDKKI
jgi:hypothetical protein